MKLFIAAIVLVSFAVLVQAVDYRRFFLDSYNRDRFPAASNSHPDQSAATPFDSYHLNEPPSSRPIDISRPSSLPPTPPPAPPNTPTLLNSPEWKPT